NDYPKIRRTYIIFFTNELRVIAFNCLHFENGGLFCRKFVQTIKNCQPKLVVFHGVFRGFVKWICGVFLQPIAFGGIIFVPNMDLGLSFWGIYFSIMVYDFPLKDGNKPGALCGFALKVFLRFEPRQKSFGN